MKLKINIKDQEALKIIYTKINMFDNNRYNNIYILLIKIIFIKNPCLGKATAVIEDLRLSLPLS